MRRTTIDVGGRRLETARWDGDRAEPTIVMLHEGLGCIDLWRDTPEQIAARTGCPVFAYSRFGYGRSDAEPLPWPPTYMHTQALDVLPNLLDAADIGSAILLGHSDGGSIATIYAGARTDPRIKGIVLIAAHFFVEDLNIAAIERIAGDYKTGGLRDRLGRYHNDVDATFHGWNGAWLNPAFRSFDIVGLLPDIAVPMLALQGADDPYGTDAQLRVLQQHVRSPLRTVLIPDARHAPHLEAREPTLAEVTRFIMDIAL